MSAIDDLVRANTSYARGFTGSPGGRPAKKLAVVTCMDTRLDLLPALGLAIGDAHLMRNAGGIVTDDMLRSLAISQRALGTREIAVIHHTQCGMDGFDDDDFRRQLTEESGSAPPWRVPGFTDLVADTRKDVHLVRGCQWIPFRDYVRGFVFDVATGRVTEVD